MSTLAYPNMLAFVLFATVIRCLKGFLLYFISSLLNIFSLTIVTGQPVSVVNFTGNWSMRHSPLISVFDSRSQTFATLVFSGSDAYTLLLLISDGLLRVGQSLM